MAATERSVQQPKRGESERVELSGRLAEFRDALEAEIDAARSAARSSAIQLIGGQRTERRGEFFQYAFKLEQPQLGLPDDLPGDLWIAGRDERVDATVVSMTGLSIVVSVREDLGANIPRAHLSSNLTNLLKVLITRIEGYGTQGRPNAAGDRLLSDSRPSGEPARVTDLDELNEDQVAAVASGLGRDCTYVLGPPGTGKTATIGALGQRLAGSGRSLLLVSHTNTAVDQALLHIARAMPTAALADGKVLRLGQPADERVAAWDDLMVDTHVERLSEGLRSKREQLLGEKGEITARITEIERLFAVSRFEPQLRETIPLLESRESDLRDLAATLARLHDEIVALERESSEWEGKRDAARDGVAHATERDRIAGSLLAARENLRQSAAAAQRIIDQAREESEGLRQQIASNATRRLSAARESLDDSQAAADAADEQLDRALQVVLQVERFERLPSVAFCQAETSRLQGRSSGLSAENEQTQALLSNAQQVLTASREANAFTRRVRRLPLPEEQLAVISRLRESAAQERIELDLLAGEIDVASAQLAEVQHLKGELDRWRDHPTVELARVAAADAHAQLTLTKASVSDAERLASEEIAAADKEIARADFEARRQAAEHQVTKERAVVEAQAGLEVRQAVIDAFVTEHGAQPAELLAQADAALAHLDDLRAQRDGHRSRHDEQAASLADDVDKLIAILDQHNLGSRNLDDSETASAPRLVILREAHKAACDIVSSLDVDALNGEGERLWSRIPAIDAEVHRISEELERVLAVVVANATVIATTLTRAYLRDEIQGRSFDTVILDEASMAPIPALWVAAGVATNNVVLVGDPHQLPPIALAADESKLDLPASKWLGRDVFHAAGVVDDAGNTAKAPEHLVALRTQYRMHPDISAAPNDLIYDGLLRDGPNTSESPHLEGWYDRLWGYDGPLVMVDMESADAWCTSVSTAGRTSRLNFLSATVSVDLAERLLREERAPPAAGQARILIATPYRPQAKLIAMLLRDQGLDGEVVAGTVHSFQGSEAPVVIYDLVVDDPHRKAGVFDPKRDLTNQRQFNVGLTRAQHRLFIVGDFKHLRSCGKKAFLGRLLEHLTPRARVVDAHDVVPRGLFARAARAESTMRGEEGPQEVGRRIVSQEEFDRFFLGDVDAAQAQVVIYSPFITSNRLSLVGPHLRAAIDRGVEVAVFTKALDDRNKAERPNYRASQQTLTEWGVKVVAKKAMHEKVVFFDSNIVWTGSLNPLSFRSTQEIMERRDSLGVAAEYRTKLQVDDALASFAASEERCPVCGSELAVAEGTDGLYLRCVVARCYSRGLKDPPLRDGKMTCRCGAELYFDKWGEQDAWRCHDNPRHHIRLHRNHLRLQAMRDLIPSRKLRALDLKLRTGPAPVHDVHDANGRALAAKAPPEAEQSSLFDDGN